MKPNISSWTKYFFKMWLSDSYIPWAIRIFVFLSTSRNVISHYECSNSFLKMIALLITELPSKGITKKTISLSADKSRLTKKILIYPNKHTIKRKISPGQKWVCLTNKTLLKIKINTVIKGSMKRKTPTSQNSRKWLLYVFKPAHAICMC